jgi:hypothetical protein
MRTHRTMALAATLSLAAGAAITDLPSGTIAAHADVSYSRSRPSAGAPAAEAILAALRQCESGGNYTSDNGDGYYGAYQFDAGTWQGLGYDGTANQAPPATQDEAVERLWSRSGWAPWPACSVALGLSSVTLPPLAKPAPPAQAKIAVVPLTTVAVIEDAPAPVPPTAGDPPRPRRFRDLVAEFG